MYYTFYWCLPLTKSSPTGYPGITTTFLLSMVCAVGKLGETMKLCPIFLIFLFSYFLSFSYVTHSKHYILCFKLFMQFWFCNQTWKNLAGRCIVLIPFTRNDIQYSQTRTYYPDTSFIFTNELLYSDILIKSTWTCMDWVHQLQIHEAS